MKRYKQYMSHIKAPDTLRQRLRELKAPEKRPVSWKKYGSMAAALALVLGLAGYGVHYWNTAADLKVYLAEAQAARMDGPEADTDIAREDPSEADQPGAKTIGGYDVTTGSGPEAVVTHYLLPYIEYGNTGEVAMCADWDIPPGASKKDLSQEEIMALMGGEDVVNTHLDWDKYELTGWAAWYEDGSFWGTYIYGYEGPLDHFEFAVTAGQLPPTCIVLPERATQEVCGLTVTASGHDSVAGPQGGVDASARRVDFMKDGYGYGFDITGTSRALTEELVSRLVRGVSDERLALYTLNSSAPVKMYTCPNCGNAFPEGSEHSDPVIIVSSGVPEDGICPICGGDATTHTHPYDPSASPDLYLCTGYPTPEPVESWEVCSLPLAEGRDASNEADCGMPDTGEPPVLMVLCAGDSLTSRSGNYSWSIPIGNGEYAGADACGVHPLEFRDAPSLTTTAQAAKLSLANPPARVEVRCWPDSEWGNTQAASQELSVARNSLTLNDEIELKPGGWIYEATAYWADGNSARYVFYIINN